MCVSEEIHGSDQPGIQYGYINGRSGWRLGLIVKVHIRQVMYASAAVVAVAATKLEEYTS